MEITKEKKLYKEIDKILWEVWDPIGINSNLNIRNEYYGYVPLIFQKIKENVDDITLANFLLLIEINRMGLDGDYEKCLIVSKKVLEIKF